MTGYSAREVAGMLGLSASQIRSYARSGFLHPERGPRGDYRFSFHDLVILRTAKELIDARIPARKIRRSLEKLHQQLPTGRPLTAVRIAASGDRVVVRDGETVWNPDSGQVLFDFAVSDLADMAAPHALRAAEEARSFEEEMESDDWYRLGCDLEITSPEEARDAYRRAVELDPHNSDAHVNLGRLLHEEGLLDSAEAHYRVALRDQSDHAVALFNLGVVLEDLKRVHEAIQSYARCIASEPEFADAHYNLAGLYEKIGKPTAALRHLKAFRKLVE